MGQDRRTRRRRRPRLREEWDAEKHWRLAFPGRRRSSPSIGTARQALWERQEAEMVAFVLTVARQVIKTEVTQNHEVVKQRHPERPATASRTRSRCGYEFPWMTRAASALCGRNCCRMLDGLHHLEIVDDRRVGRRRLRD